MGLIQDFTGLFKTKANNSFNQESTGNSVSNYVNAIFSFINGLLIFGKYNRKEFLYKGYLENPTVKFMTDYIIKKAINCVLSTGEIYEVDEMGNHILLKKDAKNNRAIKVITKVINSPINMKLSEYLKMAGIFKIIVGENITFLKRNLDDPYKNHEENEILTFGILPPHTVTIKGGSLITGIQSYISENFTEEFEPYKIYHARNANPQINLQGEHLRGLSQIHACVKWLEIDDNRAKTQNAMLQNGGVRAIISPKHNPEFDGMNPEAAKMLEQRMMEKFDSSSGNTGGRVITAQEMSIQELGRSAVDMQLLDADRWSISNWSNTFELDATTFGVSSSGFKENVNAGSKKEVTNAIIPVIDDFDAILSHIVSSYGKTFGKELIFKSDPEKHFPELQEDKVRNATVANTVNGMTGNELRTLRGLTPYEEGHDLYDDMEKPLFSSGIVPIEDIIMGSGGMPQPQPINSL